MPSILKYIMLILSILIIGIITVSLKNELNKRYEEGYTLGYNTATLELNSKINKIKLENSKKVDSIIQELNSIKRKYNENRKNTTCAELYSIVIPIECVPNSNKN